jgi:hypothetical protein
MRKLMHRLLEGAEARRAASDPALLGLEAGDARIAKVSQVEVHFDARNPAHVIDALAIDSRGSIIARKGAHATSATTSTTRSGLSHSLADAFARRQ